jgi:hypothetical protein
MEAVQLSKASGNVCQTTWRHLSAVGNDNVMLFHIVLISLLSVLYITAIDGHFDMISLNMHAMNVKRFDKAKILNLIEYCICIKRCCCYLEVPCELLSAKLNTSVLTQHILCCYLLLSPSVPTCKYLLMTVMIE